MKKLSLLLLCSVFMLVNGFAAPSNKYNLLIAPGTVTANAATILWDKQYSKDTVIYEILLNGKSVGFTGKTNYTVTKLLPNTFYTVSVRLKQEKKNSVNDLYLLKF